MVRSWFIPTRSSLAGIGKVVVTGDVIPLSTLMPDHHHTILPRVQVVVWLVFPPVLEILRQFQGQ